MNKPDGPSALYLHAALMAQWGVPFSPLDAGVDGPNVYSVPVGYAESRGDAANEDFNVQHYYPECALFRGGRCTCDATNAHRMSETGPYV